MFQSSFPCVDHPHGFFIHHSFRILISTMDDPHSTYPKGGLDEKSSGFGDCLPIHQAVQTCSIHIILQPLDESANNLQTSSFFIHHCFRICRSWWTLWVIPINDLHMRERAPAHNLYKCLNTYHVFSYK